ncbi:probable insulin-like peptide 7 [Anabrus simplex]|uniref:probable insulin-like peptide 7 n=1 Tax=Anabrus simplex TaxID=316456 RepID=UPI0035A32C45
MLLPVSTVTALCLLLDVSESASLSERELELENTFKLRSEADWAQVWHSEAYSRCRDRLVRHMYWACEKDIYRLPRREKRSLQPSYPFLSFETAKVFLRERRSRRGSITRQCCHSSNGCTWEEYAEFCPSNYRRSRKIRPFITRQL